MDKPRGFFIVEGRVVWATGQQYIRDGNNPDRTTVVYQSQGALYSTYEGDGAFTKPATPAEVADWVQGLENATAKRKAEVRAKAEQDCASMDAIVRLYRGYARESLSSQVSSKEKP